jgi:hypothetical protein
LRDELEEETKNLMGNQWSDLGTVFSIQSCTSFTVESMRINGEEERWKKGGEGGLTIWRKELGEMSEERQGGGVKSGLHLLWPHGLLPGGTGQTGEVHWSDR